MTVDAIKNALPGSHTAMAREIEETIVLRRATAADAAALALTGAATFLEAFTWMLPGPDIVAHAARHHTAEAYARYMEAPETRVTLAVTGPAAGFAGEPGSVVGYAMLCAPELPSFEVAAADIELKRIYLLSRFRTSPVMGSDGAAAAGVRPAQALMDAAVSDARSMGRERLLLGTHAGNLRAIAFYRRNGFVEAGTRTFQVGTQVCSDLIFAREL